MARTFGEFGKQMRLLGEALPVRANTIKVTVASTINNDLLLSTPVDTGEAMSNWQIGTEAATDIRPAFVASPRGFVSRKGGTHTWTNRSDPEATRQANLGPARAAADAALAAIQPGDPIHITNNTPQIVPLNDGTPSRVGRFFVQRATELAKGVVTRLSLLRD
jgi:hypothetical protein